MKQIYNFEAGSPPILNEAIVRQKLAAKRLQRQMLLLAIGSLLMLAVLAVAAVEAYRFSSVLSFACAIYCCFAVSGASVIALVFTHKRRELGK